MKRHCKLAFLFLFLLCLMAGALFADSANPSMIFSSTQAGRLGLIQAWYNQVTLDTKVDMVTDVVLADKQLFITTSASMLQVINAETGTLMWTRRVGSEKYHTYRPAANSRIVVTLNGTTLYVFDRYNGKLLNELPLYSEPMAGPQVSENFVYIPLLSKKIYAIPLVPIVQMGSNLTASLKEMDQVRKTVKFSPDLEKAIADSAKKGEQTQYLLKKFDDADISICPTFGVSLVPPIIASQTVRGDYISWTTDQGALVIGQTLKDVFHNNLKILYKILIKPQTLYFDNKRFGNHQISEKNNIQSQPHFVEKDISLVNMAIPLEKRKGGLVLVGTEIGYVLAINDITGEERWKFLTGSEIVEKISSFGDYCFIPTIAGILYCVDMKNGNEVWHTNSIKKVLSITDNSIYAIDDLERLIQINRSNGKHLATVPLGKYQYTILNDESDRIYLVSADGLVQCLREQNRIQPAIRKETNLDIAKRLEKENEVEHSKVPARPEVEGAKATSTEEVQAAVAKSDKNETKPAGDETKPAGGETKPAKKGDETKPATPSSPDDIFGETTGTKPKEPEKKSEKKKEETSDPFGDIFE